jgi:vacuolar-type H+-ATPase subunit F/Vma7
VVIPIGAVEETDLREKIKQAVGVDLWAKKGDPDR